MIYNKILENIGFPISSKVLKVNFIEELKLWRNIVAKKSVQQLKDMQEERLKTLLQYTVQNIPYYKKQGLVLTNNPYDDLRKFPVMYKKIVKENISNLYVGNKEKMVVEKSSGSSGIQGEVYMTLKENLAYQAVQTFIWEWGGYKLGTPLLQTGMTLERKGIKKIKDILLRTVYVNSFNLSHDQMVKNLVAAKKKGCTFFGGYASALNIHAEAALKAGLDVEFKGVISWGDKLFDHYKSNINKAFNNPTIAEVYGTTEGFMIAGLCEKGNHHILSPHVCLELLDKDGKEVAPGELGYVVVTRLDAFSFPLIRFYLGDLAIKEKEDVICDCGRAFPLLRKIVGRDTDIVYTPNGKALIVHFFTAVFEHKPGVKQFRVIQSDPLKITIEIIPSSTFKEEDLQQIATILNQKAGEDLVVDFIQVESIPDTASGKPQIIKNTLAKKLNDYL